MPDSLCSLCGLMVLVGGVKDEYAKFFLFVYRDLDLHVRRFLLPSDYGIFA